MDKNRALVEYLLNCEGIKDSPIYFNFIEERDKTKQFITTSNDTSSNEEYIDGSVRKKYQLTVYDYRSTSAIPLVKLPAVINENLEEIEDVQFLIDWIKEQNRKKIFPDFGDKCIIDEIYTTTENPVLDMVDASVQPPLARYRVTITVDYLDISDRLWN